jgi:hypothetical protein
MLPIANNEPAINKLNYASNLKAFTKEFNILTLETNFIVVLKATYND